MTEPRETAPAGREPEAIADLDVTGDDAGAVSGGASEITITKPADVSSAK